jgi:hypothetical protein
MPFYKDYSDENATILYWKYSEEDHFEIDELIEPENLEKAKDYHPKKLIEHLMVRKLLKMVLPDRKFFTKRLVNLIFGRLLHKFLLRILFRLLLWQFLKIE